MRDYIADELQAIQSLVEKLNRLEDIPSNRRGRDYEQLRKNARSEAIKERNSLLDKAQPIPSATYQFLTAIDGYPANETRTEWQKNNQRVGDCLRENIKDYYEKNFESPDVDLAILPAYSFVLQFRFALAQPYISHDEQDFYIIYNPVRKDKIFELPYVASTSWKGSLRATLWQLEHGRKDISIKAEAIYRLFGNERAEKDQEKLRAGRLYFFPTFFRQKSLEIINPQDREKRIGTDPILFESVPPGASGIFTLLYVPFDRIGQDEKETRKQVAEELKIVAEGLHAMFCTYGFGAKSNSGFGLAKEMVEKVLLEIQAPGILRVSESSINFKQLTQVAENLAKRLKEG